MGLQGIKLKKCIYTAALNSAMKSALGDYVKIVI